MPTCIYCKAATDGTEPPEHPLPEAAGSRAILPPGASCRACNSYVSELDDVLLRHPHLGSFVAMARVPGKRNKRRTLMTEWSHVHHESGRIHFEIKRIDTERSRFSDGAIVLQIADDPRFDPWKFTRALHKVALGMVALCEGVDSALVGEFDEVRRYIRRPHGRHEYRPYLQRISGGPIPRTDLPWKMKYYFSIRRSENTKGVYVYLHLWVDEFIVALQGDALQIPLSLADFFGQQAKSNGMIVGPDGAWIRQQQKGPS